MEEFFIVGSGPVGLSAAIFLTKNGKKVRIIDKSAHPIQLSKALVVNSRSLEIFRQFDMDEELIRIGHKLYHLTMHLEHKEVSISTASLPSKYNYILIIPQSKTEAFLEKKLNGLGVQVERGVTFNTFKKEKEGYELTLQTSKGPEMAYTRFLLGADGMHSTVRDAASIEFHGKDYQLEIYAMDALLEGSLNSESGHSYINKEGEFVILFSMHDNYYRILSNLPITKTSRPGGMMIKNIDWDTKFHIHCKRASVFNEGNLYLMGDAAHVHSPLGGRGMNLGIEDAFIFVEYLMQNKLSHYNEDRMQRSLQILAETDKATQFLLANGPFARFLKFTCLPILLKIPFIRNKILAKNMGLG